MNRKIGIFLSGSTNPKISEEYYKAAVDLGKMIDIQKHNIIFDGCDGLPGLVASQIGRDNFHNNLLIALADYYGVNAITNNWPGAIVRVFKHQSEVTKTLLDWSDIAVFFKGNSGTLAELFHAIDTKKNREHSKPIIILNLENQWDDLLRLLEPLKLSHLYHVVNNPEKIMDYIEEAYTKLAKSDYIR